MAETLRAALVDTRDVIHQKYRDGPTVQTQQARRPPLRSFLHGALTPETFRASAHQKPKNIWNTFCVRGRSSGFFWKKLVKSHSR